jgi:uncharacterized protein YprB with RNaseH-like and TPR domain
MGRVGLLEKLRRISAPAGLPEPRESAGELPGDWAEGSPGRFWLRRARFPLTHAHGAVRLEELLAAPAAALAPLARDEALDAIDFRRAVFFDTETTSLGGGAGTYVFLLGAGYFEDDAFVVEQYFLREMADEPALLRAVNERFGASRLAVSFYGKGFDTPRLLDRFAFHRIRPALPRAHLDLCVVGRGLYRGAFPDCRLQTFERELVKFERVDDLPGEMCPRAFFAFLRGDASLVARVFEHNLHDILSLPAVAACFAREAEAPRHPVVLANLGALHEGAGRDAQARAAYAAALPGLRALRHPQLARALERLALLERRAGRHAVSARLLLERKDVAPRSLEAFEDLAKFFEHRARDLERAEAIAAEARAELLNGRIALDALARGRRLRDLDHRLARLRRRRARDSLS